MSSTSQQRSRESTLPTHDYGDADRFLNENNEHPLWSDFTFWMFSKRSPPAFLTPPVPSKEIDVDSLFDQSKGDQSQSESQGQVQSQPAVPPRPKTEEEKYLDSFVKIGPFDTVEGFWKLYSHIKRAGPVPTDFTYHCFRGGVQPIFEDPANQNGGKWSVRLRRNLGPRFFEIALLSVIGNEYNLGEEINGVALSCRKPADVVSIWVSSQDPTSISRMNQVIKRWAYACSYVFAPGVGGVPAQASTSGTPSITALEFIPHTGPYTNTTTNTNTSATNTNAATTTNNRKAAPQTHTNQTDQQDDDLMSQIFGEQPQQQQQQQQGRGTKLSALQQHNLQLQQSGAGVGGFSSRSVNNNTNTHGAMNRNASASNHTNRFASAYNSANNRSTNTNHNNADPVAATARLQPGARSSSQSLISNTLDDDFTVMTFDSPSTTGPTAAAGASPAAATATADLATGKNDDKDSSDKGFVVSASSMRPRDPKKNRAAARQAEKQAAAAAAAKKNPFADLDD